MWEVLAGELGAHQPRQQVAQRGARRAQHAAQQETLPGAEDRTRCRIHDKRVSQKQEILQSRRNNSIILTALHSYEFKQIC